MFGKLLKNDLKAQWHSVSSIFLCIMIIITFAEIYITFARNTMLASLAGLVIVLLLLFACLVIIIAVAMMFSKTVFGRAGYLTLTLPVKTSKLIWSKTLSGLIWTYTVYTLFFLFFFLWIHQCGNYFGAEYKDMANQIFAMLLGKSISTMLSTLAYYLIWFGIVMFVIVQCLYLGITCSHVKPLSSLGIVGTVLIFFASFAVVVAVTGFFTKYLPFGMVVYENTVVLTSNIEETKEAMRNYLLAPNFAGPVVMLVLSSLINIPTTYLVKNKVNIK